MWLLVITAVVLSMGSKQFDRQTIIDAVTNKSVKILSTNKNTVLNYNTIERHIFFSPKGTVSRVINMQINWQPITETGVTGTRRIYVDNYISDTSGLGNFNAIDSAYNLFAFDQSQFSDGYNYNSNITLQPNDLSAVAQIARGLTFDETTGLSIAFIHTMNGNFSEVRSVLLFVEQEVVSR